MNFWSFVISLIVALQGPRQMEPNLTPIPPPKGSLVQAKAISSCIRWVSPYYVWRNKSTILIFCGDDNDGRLEGLEEYHLDTGKHDTLDALNRKWLDNPLSLPDKDAPAIKGGAVNWPAVSPDGKWIVWSAFRANVGGLPGIQMTISLDGRHWAERPMQPRDPNSVWSITWSHDSRSWTGLLGNDKTALVYDVYTQQEHRYDFSSRVTLPRVEYAFWKLLEQRSNGHLLLMLSKARFPPNNDILLAEIPQERESDAAKQWAIKMPPSAYASEVALSPSGDRLIWNIQFVPPGWDPHNPVTEAQSKQFHNEIWLSDLDGSSLQRLGNLVFNDSDRDIYYKQGLRGLQWVPDGKHISYIYDRVLYLVAVP